MTTSSRPVRIAMIGAGAVSDYHHVPAIRFDPRATLVAACDTSQELLQQRRTDWNIQWTTNQFEEVCTSPDVDAVIIATPNFTHRAIAVLAAQNGKHIMCEKPLGLNADEVREMYYAARDHQVVHMTAFTYRFAPAMRYLTHLVKSGSLGTPRHFRSQRFLDWPETSWGWRQYKDKAGAGDLYDMTIHRIDFAIDLLGPLKSLSGAVARFAPRDRTKEGQTCPPSEVDDWSTLIGMFECHATGVWEGTTLAKGYGLKGFGHEWAEVNGSESSGVYRMHDPNHILLGKTGSDLAPVEVPPEFLKPASSPRDPSAGEPAIVERRDAIPSFYDGLRAQVVADLVLRSYAERRWLDVPNEPK
jgi:predicted dehydrogenase